MDNKNQTQDLKPKQDLKQSPKVDETAKLNPKELKNEITKSVNDKPTKNSRNDTNVSQSIKHKYEESAAIQSEDKIND